jgi:two-component system, NarL family, response regulator LiaR
MDRLRRQWSAGAGQVTLPARSAARLVGVVGRHAALSERETEVLCLVARGLANKQIARELGITPSTIKCHVGSILGKLDLLSRTQVALYAARTGLVALERLGGEAAAN